MKKLFGLFLLAIACWAPDFAQAAGCFWVGGTGTWNQTNTGGGGAGGIKWASASGGGTACAATSGPAAGVPGPSDTATFDGSSGGGTVTVDFGGLITIQSLTCGAFTGTLDFSANDNDVTLTGTAGVWFSGTGSGARTINLGDGTWTLSTTTNNITLWNLATTTSLTFNANASTIVFNNTGLAAASLITFSGGALTYNTFTVQTGDGNVQILGNNTFAALNLPAGINLVLPATTTITGGFTWIGTSANPIIVQNSGFNGSGTIDLNTATGTAEWIALRSVIGTDGTFSATNAFDLGGNTGWTITPPSAGGGGGRIIGG